MKQTLFTFISAAVVAAALVSCAKTELLNGDLTPKGDGISVNVLADEVITKTYVEDGEVPVVKWSKSDDLALFEIVDGAVAGKGVSDPANIGEDGKATFSATLDWEAEGTDYKYSAVYPSTSVYEISDGKYVLYMPEVQNLEGNNLDLNSDVLVSSVANKGASRVAEGESLKFSFTRVGTVVRLTLKGIPAGEKISQVKMTAPAKVAGTIAFDPVTGKVDPESRFSTYGDNVITLNVGDVVATGADVVWFRVMSERDWGEKGDEVTFEVITDKNLYKKVITSCPTMKFFDGGLTKFGVNLEGCVAEPLSVPFYDSFEEGSENWTLLDKDGDGYKWDIYGGVANTGDYALWSASYDNSVGVLYPDNWAFTPLVQLTTDNYLSFYLRAVDPEWPAEHYAVYIAEGSPAAEPAVLIAETEFPKGNYVDLGEDGVYQRFVVKIPEAYENKVVTIGFRHFNCTDQYVLALDDVEITEGKPEYGCDAKYEDYLGEWAQGGTVWTVAEKENGVSYSISGLKDQGENPVVALFESGRMVVYEQMVASDASSEVWLQGSDGYFPSYPGGSDVRILWAEYDGEADQITISAGAYSYYMFITYEDEERVDYSFASIPSVMVPHVPDPTTYLYYEDFETDNTADWTLIDADKDGFNWHHASRFSYSGSYVLASQSYDSTEGALIPDNWAFTPAVKLTSDNYLSFWIAAQDPKYAAEHYAVYITTEAPDADNLSACEVLIPEREFPDGDPVDTFDGEDGRVMQRYVVPIPSSYAGKDVYIGFRHFNCTDMFYLNLDDVAISEGNPVAETVEIKPKRSSVKGTSGLKMRDDRFQKKDGRKVQRETLELGVRRVK